jgi:acetyl-CoA acyltransferase
LTYREINEAWILGAVRIPIGTHGGYMGCGVESMSRAPWAAPKADGAFPTGHLKMYDTTLGWRFVNSKMEAMGHTDSLGVTADNLAEERFHVTAEEQQPEGLAGEYDIFREAQDRFALRSHEKAVAAMDEKRFRQEIVPVMGKGRKGEETVVEADEGPRRDTSLEKLGKLKPSFKEGGSVTAGNSSSLNDGAAAVLVVAAEYARAHGLKPLAKIRSMVSAGVPPRVMGIGPVPATRKALDRASIALEDVGLVELNEAFAA